MLTTINIKDAAHQADEIVKNVARIFKSVNGYTHDRKLRKYQSRRNEEIGWAMPHPLLNIEARAKRSIIHLPKSFSYEFVSKMGGTIWLISTPIATGYAIQGAYVVDSETLYYDPSFIGLSYFEGRVAEIKADRSSDEPLAPFVYVYGHENFAHEFWNEFSGLLKLDERKFCNTAIMAQPGTVAKLPELLERTKLAEKFAGVQKNTLRYGVKYNALLYAAGSEVLSNEAKGIITAVCLDKHPLDSFFAADDRYRVVITLRSLYRHALNEDEAFRAIIVELCALSDKIDIYLDGYSVPTDPDGIAPAAMDRHLAISRRVSERAAALIAALPEGLAGRVFDGTACTLAQSIANGSRCHFYISHHGTQQHKFGWLFVMPGIVHANRSILQSLPAGWVQKQSQDSILPHYVALEDIADTDDPTNDRNHAPYFSNYLFADIPRFVKFCIDLVKVDLERAKSVEPVKSVEPTATAPVAPSARTIEPRHGFNLQKNNSKVDAMNELGRHLAPGTPLGNSNEIKQFYDRLMNQEVKTCNTTYFTARDIIEVEEASVSLLCPPILFNGAPINFPKWDFTRPMVTATQPFTVAKVENGFVGMVYDAPTLFDADLNIEPNYSSYYSLLYGYVDNGRMIDFANAKQIDGDVFVMLDDVGGLNFSHWLCDWLPRLKAIRDNPDIFVLTLPLTSRWQTELLEAFGIGPERCLSLPKWGALRARNVYMPSGLSHIFHPAYKGAPWAVEFLRENILPRSDVDLGSKIYLSRSDAPDRRVVNEDAFETYLKSIGFRCFAASEYTPVEQASIFHHADTVVSLHGAGMTNVLFCKPGTKVLEIIPSTYSTPAFWVLAAARRMIYGTYICENIVKSVKRDHPQADSVRIDIDHFRRLVGDYLRYD
ncbi:glycosyltransferase family 61 protein [Methylorubrum sp. SB2]|uniref:glycosyltransferase family 61 protein n=1 Tax=Methylorubrum subtropicum TaxID=3138812 RepID=UPI00313E4FA6